MSSKDKASLVYFADPMCSWCWGFAPIIKQISCIYGERIPIQMIMGGLYAGNTDFMDQATKQDIQQHWQHVHEASGQNFNHAFFERDQFIYNTEPPCRAVITCQRLKADAGLKFLEHLQHAFYVSNRDITDPSILIELASEFGLDEELFEQKLLDEEIKRFTQLNFQYTRHCNVNGFPTLVAQSKNVNRFITRGYQSLENIQPAINDWLNQLSINNN
jgi:putative protein-disulfide isomerase